MILQEIIDGHEQAINLYADGFYSEEKYHMEIILTLAKEIQALKDYVQTQFAVIWLVVGFCFFIRDLIG